MAWRALKIKELDPLLAGTIGRSATSPFRLQKYTTYSVV
jgi:hypothetical protein